MALYDPRKKKKTSSKKTTTSNTSRAATAKQQMRAKITASRVAQQERVKAENERARKEKEKNKKPYVSPYERKHGKPQSGVEKLSIKKGLKAAMGRGQAEFIVRPRKKKKTPTSVRKK
jgi:hypothetical protein